MNARLLSRDAEVAVFPICVDATTLGTPDSVWRDFEINIKGTSSIPPQVVEKGKQQLFHMAATGPSKVSVWPYVPDAKVAAFPRRDATILDTPDPVWQDFETDVGAVDWILLPMVEKGEQQLFHPVAATGPSEVSVWSSALDVTEDSGDDIAILEIIAETGDETAFVQAASEIDWSQHPAVDFARAVRLALAAGAHLLARKLADYGHRLYPNCEELAKMAHILAPPRAMRANLPPDPSVRANLEWMRTHAVEYRGQWVALKDGVFLATAPTARELKDKLPTTDGLFLTRVI